MQKYSAGSENSSLYYCLYASFSCTFFTFTLHLMFLYSFHWPMVHGSHCQHGNIHLTHWPLGNFRHVIFKQILLIDGWGISCEIALIRISLDFADDQSRFVQVMAWCHQVTSHYLNQCWLRSLSPYGVTRPQRGWVKMPEILWITF